MCSESHRPRDSVRKATGAPPAGLHRARTATPARLRLGVEAGLRGLLGVADVACFYQLAFNAVQLLLVLRRPGVARNLPGDEQRAYVQPAEAAERLCHSVMRPSPA